MKRTSRSIPYKMCVRIGGILGLCLMATALTAHAVTYTVTTTADSAPGENTIPGSLRDAIERSNQSVLNPDIIAFNISGPGPHTITPLHPLPTITDAVTIDGYTQPGASRNTEANGNNAVLQIVLDGAMAGRQADGLRVTATEATITGLVIHHFGRVGVLLEGKGSNVISGNFIGTDVAGQTIHHNGHGIVINPGSSDNIIGGATPEARNVISGNLYRGIGIIQANRTVVEGNCIGTDKTGNTKVSNGEGIEIFKAQSTRIGGTTSGQRNVISGNEKRGIKSTEGSEQMILGNFIGTDVSGSGALGNGASGVLLHSEQNTVVGQTTAGAGNRIAHNQKSGVAVSGSTAIGNAIRGNNIFNNTALGIDLLGDGVTPNDPAPDTDTGPNRLQNFPILTAIETSGAGIKVSGFLDSVPNTTFDIDFYATDVRDPSGHGEGPYFLGSIEVTTNNQGHFTFAANLPAPPGPWISATATRKGPNPDTSEYSPFLARHGKEFGANNTNNDGPDSLRQALAAANSNGNPDEVDQIVFHIPGDGPHVIHVSSPLVITQPVHIHGHSQPGSVPNSALRGFNGVVNIVLDGSHATAPVMVVLADNSTICSLSIVNNQPPNRFGAVQVSGDGNWFTGNLLGLWPNGTSGPNLFSTVLFGNDNRLGGPHLEDRNVLSSNQLSGAGVAGSGNVVENNLIGTDFSGTRNQGNGEWGVSTSALGMHNTIRNNVIAFNAFGGVENAGQGITISQNRIFNNPGLGIDVPPTGVNPPIPGAPQNPPVLESATTSGNRITITGTLNNTPRTPVNVEFFKSPRCDPSGSGEGKTFLGMRTFTTNAAGNKTFRAVLSAIVSAGQAITATAIDPSGNTSEFSQCIAALRP